MKNNLNHMWAHVKNDLFMIMMVMFALASAILITGCSEKVRVITIHPPKLKLYQGCDTELNLTAYNHDGKICIRQWDNACVPKTEFIKLYKYIQNIKTTCKKYESEIKIQNRD